MALGEDYNILVMSRIREEAHNHVSLRDAVARAISVTGGTVTSAGLILAGTFFVLGISGGNPQVEQIGFAIAFGIMLRHVLRPHAAGAVRGGAAGKVELVAVETLPAGCRRG